MGEKEHIEFLGKIRKLAEEKGISLEELTEKEELGELGLKFWEEAGEKKEPEEFLRVDLAELVKEVKHLRECP